MFLFGGPNVSKMLAERDYDGLAQCLEHRSASVRLEAAQALAELSDGRGWRYLLDTIRHPASADEQAIAAEMLGEMGYARAVPVLQEALPSARGQAREAIEEALRSLGVGEPESRSVLPDPEARSLQPEGESFFNTLFGGMNDDISDSDTAHPVLPNTDIEFLSAQQHLDNAAQLREHELQERGLVECSLALWLKPDWAYAWYLRGVLMEDLEREREALIAYSIAQDLDPTLPEAREALGELQESNAMLAEQPEEMLKELLSDDWRERRDGAALLAQWLVKHPGVGSLIHENVVDGLIEALSDPEREIRHAAVEALGLSGAERAVDALEALNESSWLLRFALLQALSDLKAVDALISRLDREMSGFQARNPVFSSQKDPLLELEYNLLMEAGVLALERTGDLEGLLDAAENNAWEEVDEDEEEEPEEEDLDEDLQSYVDEPSQMAAVALERLARRNMPALSRPLLERLASIPDLTLLDLENEQGEPVILIDFSDLRAQAGAYLRRAGQEG